ncbi:P68 family surface lipoprotein [Mycoplasma hafezii]|uniref:P68 family surface lipoprotein n=1 Tax=Mycoplasma hafezii TaxID=525886 RepID=UPI003CED08FA
MKKRYLWLLTLTGTLGVTTSLVATSCKDENQQPASDKQENKQEHKVAGTTVAELYDSYADAFEFDSEKDLAHTDLFGTNEKSRINASMDGANSQGSGFMIDERESILLGTSFSESGFQGKAIAALVSAYNEYVAQHKAENPFLKPVVVKVLGSGYPNAANTLELDLNAGASSTKTFVNMAINYNAIASKLAAKNMLLSFNSVVPQLNVDITNFAKQFSNANFQIADIENLSTYSLPLFKSTNIMSINAPVLYYIVKNILDNGGKLADNQETKDFYQLLEEKGKGDWDGVKSLWDIPVLNIKDIIAEELTSSNSAAIFDVNIFKNYVDLLKFSSFAQKLFANSFNQNEPYKAAVHMFGIDDMPAVFEASMASLAEGDLKNTHSYSYTNNGVIDVAFDGLQNNDVASQNARLIYNDLVKATQDGAIIIQPGGAYSSNQQKLHKFAFALSSTAGYEYSYYKNGDEGYRFVSPTNTLFDVNYDIATNYQSFRTLDKTDAEGQLGILGKYKSPIYSLNNQTHKIGIYDIQPLSEKDEEQIKGAIDKSHNALTFTFKLNSELLKDTKMIEKMKSHPNYAGTLKIGGDDKKQAFLFIINNAKTEKLNNSNAKPEILDFAKSLGYTVQLLNTTNQLNENELITLPAPLQWDREHKTKVIFTQGPSLIGVKSNEIDDLATKAFAKWLITDEKAKFIIDPKKPDKFQLLTPKQFIAKSFSYITPIKGYENTTDEEIKLMYGKNNFLITSFNTFKNGALDKDVVLYEEPAASGSTTFRDSLRAAFDAVTNTILGTNGKKPQTYEKFVEGLYSKVLQK